MVELSRYRAVNIIGAVILLLISTGWAAWSWSRDGQYIIRDGMVVGVWVVDPAMKALPVVLIVASLAIIVLAVVWPKTAIDDAPGWTMPGTGRRLGYLFAAISAASLAVFIGVDGVPNNIRTFLLALGLCSVVLTVGAAAWPYVGRDA